MTTAARPTFEPARGGRGKGENDLSALSKQYSSRDLPSHTKLKYRQTGQATSEELQSRDFRRELEEKEQVTRQKRDREKPRSFTEAPAISSHSHSSSGGGSGGTKRARLEPPPASVDADDPVDDEDEDEDSDDSDDDTAELLRELQKIRKERKEEQEKKEQEQKEEEERIRTENLLKGNPLLNQQTSNFKVKRRWDDDVVFKNCARQEPKNKERHFINDTIRSEFHKKFMDKYVK